MDEPDADHTIVSERARSDHRIPAPPSEHPAPPHAPGPTRPGEPPVRARTRGRRVLPWIVLILIVGAVAWALLRPRGTTPAPGGHHQVSGNVAQPVAEAAARTGDMPIVLTELGTVTPLATVTVQSQIAGYLLDVNFTEGQEVHRGQQLALIDPRPYQATRDQYQGLLTRDMAALNQAKIDLARYELLLRQHSIAEQTVADQRYTVGQEEGAVQTDHAEIEAAELNIAYCHITAPVDGRVGLRQVDAGNYVTQSMTNGLVVVTQLHPISVIFSVPEDVLGEVSDRIASGAKLPVDAYDRTDTKKIASGVVTVLDNVVDTATGTVKLRAVFDNKENHLFPNQFVNARMLLDTLHDAVLVPTSAVQTGPQGQFVYVVGGDSKVAIRTVKTGASNGTDTVIASGLKTGETVVTDGTDHLRGGSKVMVPKAPPPGQAAPGGAPRHRHRPAADQ